MQSPFLSHGLCGSRWAHTIRTIRTIRMDYMMVQGKARQGETLARRMRWCWMIECEYVGGGGWWLVVCATHGFTGSVFVCKSRTPAVQTNQPTNP